MQCLLIQIEGSLLWQILANAKLETLQSLDQLLEVLEVEANPLPVQACMAETEWNWLRQQIRARYEFDLAEEVLLRLDLIGIRDPAPTDCLYAILTTSDFTTSNLTTSDFTTSEELTDRSFVPLKLSISEFLALYQAICCLEAAYIQSEAGMPESLSEQNLPEQSLPKQPGLGLKHYLASMTALFLPSERSLGREQVLLLGLALVLVLLPRWEALQRGLILTVQAEESEASQFTELMQTATQWLSQTVGQLPPVSTLAKLNPASSDPSVPTPSAITEDFSPDFHPANSQPVPIDPFPRVSPAIVSPAMASPVAVVEFSSLIRSLSQVVLQASADPIAPAGQLDASNIVNSTLDLTLHPTTSSGLTMPGVPAGSNLPQPAIPHHSPAHVPAHVPAVQPTLAQPASEPPGLPSENQPDAVEPQPNQRPNPPGIADIGIADSRPVNLEASPSPASPADLAVVFTPEPTSFPNALPHQVDSLLGINLLGTEPWHPREPEGGDTLLFAGASAGASAVDSIVSLPQLGVLTNDLTAQVLAQTQVVAQTEQAQPQPLITPVSSDFGLGIRPEVIPIPHSSHDYSGLS